MTYNITQDTLVKLTNVQGSCVQQLTDSQGQRLDWEVFSRTGELLFTLPKRINDAEIEKIQQYARTFEKQGFIAGTEYSDSIKNKEIALIKEQYDRELQRMREENDRIATVLDRLMLQEHIDNDDQDPQSKIGIPEYML